MDPKEIEKRLSELKTQYPHWWNYSDTLGERPVDGMIREIHYNAEQNAMMDALRNRQEMQKQQRDQSYYATPEAQQYQEEQINSGRLPQGTLM